MAVTKAKKSEILGILEEHLKDAQSVAFTSNQKLTVLETSGMKKEIRAAGGVYMIAKKTLICIAFKKVLGVELDRATLPGQVAILICKADKIAPLAAINKTAQELKKEEKIKFVGGYIDGRLLSAAETTKLASLPSREVLLAKLLGSMMSPLSGLARFFDAAGKDLTAKGLSKAKDLIGSSAAPAVAVAVVAPVVAEVAVAAETPVPEVVAEAPAAETTPVTE